MAKANPNVALAEKLEKLQRQVELAGSEADQAQSSSEESSLSEEDYESLKLVSNALRASAELLAVVAVRVRALPGVPRG